MKRYFVLPMFLSLLAFTGTTAFAGAPYSCDCITKEGVKVRKRYIASTHYFDGGKHTIQEACEQTAEESQGEYISCNAAKYD